jgi:DNA polymerase V
MDQQTSVTAVFAGVSPEPKAIPLYASSPQAGFPAPGDDLVRDELNVHDLLVKHPESTFFVRVEGDSMEGAGIFSGDVLVIDRSVEPKNGHIVVAVVDGGLVVKRVRVTSEGMSLVSENAAYAPIVVSPESECTVWGVVTGSIRQF